MEYTKTDVTPKLAVTTDSFFCEKCIDMLHQQETTLWQLRQATEKAKNDESLDLILVILDRFLDFAEKQNQFNSDDLDFMAEHLQLIRSHTVTHKQKQKTHSWKRLRSLAGLKSPCQEDIRQSYQELSRKYLGMVEHFFQICHNKIPEIANKKETFDATAVVFLDDFKERI